MDRQLAFVVLDRPVEVDMEKVAEVLRRRHPRLAVEVVAPSVGGHGAAQPPLIRCNGEPIAFMNIGAPLPRERPSDEVWARAARTWPEAPSVLEKHRAHFVIAALGNAGSALREARLVTAVVGAALETFPGCLAVMWAGRVVRPAASWKDESRTAFAPYPNYPLLLWIDLAAVRTASGFDAVTIGLSTFTGREIEYEVGRDSSGVLGKVANLAIYLTEHGNKVKHGHTFGESEAERIKIHDARSRRLGGAPVWRIGGGEVASRYGQS